MDLVAKSLDVPLEEIVDKAKDWALLNGLTMRSEAKVSDRVEFVPFALLPSRFPRSVFEEARSLQRLVNELVHRVAGDYEFLRETLASCARIDEFTRRLVHVLEETSTGGCVQPLALGLLRSDFMLRESEEENEAESRCKQVEVNTIACGQGWIGTACSRLHRYLLRELDLTEASVDTPENEPLDGLCLGMLRAWKIYDNPSAAVLFVVEEETRHIGEQRLHEYRLRLLEPRIRVLRLSLVQVARRARLEGPDHRLLVDEVEVGLVYFRSGYAPSQYPDETAWTARLLLERSRAVKCPTIGYQLAGTKKVQQVLAKPRCLERFLGTEDSTRMRRFFTGLYSLDFDEEGEAATAMALERPSEFVLKPQREGGANNVFGEEVRRQLSSMGDERTAWILMDKIAPMVQRNYLVRPGGGSKPRLEDVTSELGVFGVVLGDSDRILVNDTVGHTLRTKLAHRDEGGVSSGFGACDSPFLV